jgi:hypothetical protein
MLADLKRFADAVKPTSLIPIHTEHAVEYEDHFRNVLKLADKEVFEL